MNSASTSEGTTRSASTSEGTTSSASTSEGTTRSASTSEGTTSSASTSEGTTSSASTSASNGYVSKPQQDPEKIKTYDPNLETNFYETKGSYTLRLVGQLRINSRQRRSMGETDLTNMEQSSLLGFINQS